MCYDMIWHDIVLYCIILCLVMFTICLRYFLLCWINFHFIRCYSIIFYWLSLFSHCSLNHVIYFTIWYHIMFYFVISYYVLFHHVSLDMMENHLVNCNDLRLGPNPNGHNSDKWNIVLCNFRYWYVLCSGKWTKLVKFMSFTRLNHVQKTMLDSYVKLPEGIRTTVSLNSLSRWTSFQVHSGSYISIWGFP